MFVDFVDSKSITPVKKIIFYRDNSFTVYIVYNQMLCFKNTLPIRRAADRWRAFTCDLFRALQSADSGQR